MAKERVDSVKIVCSQCGAKFERLPAYTCPRCGNPLCAVGCDGCLNRSCSRRAKTPGNFSRSDPGKSGDRAAEGPPPEDLREDD